MTDKSEAAARVRRATDQKGPRAHGAFWAPGGTVRATLALALVFALIALEAAGIEAKQVGTLAGVAVTFYFTARNGKPSGG